VPNPAPLFVCIVALASSLSGLASGLISAVIAGGFRRRCSSSITVPMPGYDTSDIARMILLALTAASTAVITGLLRQKWVDAFAWERKHHATATRLVGSARPGRYRPSCCWISDTRAEFINRAFRDTFALPDERPTASRPLSRSCIMAATPAPTELTGGGTLRLHRGAHRDDCGRATRRQSTSTSPTGRVLRFSWHGASRRGAHAELHAGDGTSSATPTRPTAPNSTGHCAQGIARSPGTCARRNRA